MRRSNFKKEAKNNIIGNLQWTFRISKFIYINKQGSAEENGLLNQSNSLNYSSIPPFQGTASITPV